MFSKIFSIALRDVDIFLIVLIGIVLLVVVYAIYGNVTKKNKIIKKAQQEGLVGNNAVFALGILKYTGKDAAKDVAKTVAIVALVALVGGAAAWSTGPKQIMMALEDDKLVVFPMGDQSASRSYNKKLVIPRQDIGAVSIDKEKANNVTVSIFLTDGSTINCTIRPMNKETRIEQVKSALNAYLG